jgi:hypothetical protein
LSLLEKTFDIAAIGLAPFGFSIGQKLQSCFCDLYTHKIAAPFSANSRNALTIIRFTSSFLGSARADYPIEEVT